MTGARPSRSSCCRRSRRGLGEDGFTLLELLVVLSILALIMAVTAPQVTRYLSNARAQTAATQLSTIESALELYSLDIGAYPPEGAGLDALITEPAGVLGWTGPYLPKGDNLIDPWERPYLYRIPGEHGRYDLYSLGRDGAEGGEDEDADVTNW
jgi:general secretion pathway protein G